MKKSWILVLLLTCLAAVVFVWQKSSRQLEIRVGQATLADIETSFVAEAFVKGKVYKVSSEVPGRMDWLGVREGDVVVGGQEVARINDADLERELSQAKAVRQTASQQVAEALSAYRTVVASNKVSEAKSMARVRQVEAELARVKGGPRMEEIERARHEVNRSRVLMEEAARRKNRAEMLFNEGAISAAARDLARTEHAASIEQYESALDALHQLQAGPLPEEVASAIAQLDVAKADYRLAIEARGEARTRLAQVGTARARLQEAIGGIAQVETRREKLRVLSPKGGTVVKVFAEQGEVVASGTPILEIASREDFHVEAEIRSEDLNSVKPGTKVRISSPTTVRRTFDGVVERLTSQAEPKPDAAIRTRIIRTRIRVVNPDSSLVPGMEVDVTGTSSLKSALTVPNEAILLEGAAAYVWLVKSGAVTKNQVRMGLSDRLRTELVEGVAISDQVVLDPPADLKEGQKVTVRVEQP